MTAVVHLARYANGLAPFEEFVTSYARHDAGLDHDLVLLWKGFPSADTLAPFRRLAPQGATETQVHDRGRDIYAFLAAARALEHERVCFLNSFTEIQAPGWLAQLANALDTPGAGIAGATGSWGSHRSFALLLLGLPSAYRGALDKTAFVEAVRSLDSASETRWLRRLMKAAVDLPREIIGYEGFPAPHVRTNAFLIERRLLLSLVTGTPRGRSASYRFEGGRRGLTSQILASGLRAFVVSRDGCALKPEQWPDADIFWQGHQGGLLVADNQTRVYDRASHEQRVALSRFAWGERSRVS
jgi:hypothetical protein